MIHEGHDAVSVMPEAILQLHRDLYRLSGDSFAGQWKDFDNVIADRAADGGNEEMLRALRPAGGHGNGA